jgi:RND family efflux transporter MFP subunit
MATPPSAKRTGGATVVQVQEAVAKPFALQLLSNGKLHAPLQSKVQFRASGYIRQVYVRNGQAVAAGALLAQLDDRPAQLLLEQAQDALRQAQVEANDRLISLRGKADDSLSVAPKIWAYIKTASGLNQARIAIQKAQLELEACTLRAPFAGTVANLSAKAFNQANPSEVFCTLLATSTMELTALLLESETAQVQIGQSARVTALALPTQTWNGTVSEINPFVNEQGLVEVKVRVQNPRGLLFEGMNAQVVIEKTVPGLVVVPKSAVVERSGRKVVFVAEGNVAKWHYVTVAAENASQVGIAEGLKAGERVIVSGNLNLAHDAEISVQTTEERP